MTYGIKTDLVHDCDASLLSILLQLHHGRGDVRSSDYILLGADSSLDDGSVMDVWDEGDDELDLGQLGVQGSRVIDVQGDGVGVLDALAKPLGALEGTAGCFISSLAGGLES